MGKVSKINIVIAKKIVEKGQMLLAEFGSPKKIGGKTTVQVAAATIGNLNIMMTTPFSNVKTGHGDFRYQMDIYDNSISTGSRKVFGAAWDPQKKWADEFECFRFVKGGWINGLLE